MQTWKCLGCGKTFGVGEWTCSDGQSNHVVDKKDYLMNDAPSDPGHVAPGSTINVALRDGRTRICAIPPDKKVVVAGEVQTVPGGYVEFIQGRFSTSDPEQQYWLDKKGGFCDQAAWDRAWLTDAQQLNKQRLELDAMRNRLEVERNELLESAKQRVGA